jgi:hypothetical protein
MVGRPVAATIATTAARERRTRPTTAAAGFGILDDRIRDRDG